MEKIISIVQLWLLILVLAEMSAFLGAFVYGFDLARKKRAEIKGKNKKNPPKSESEEERKLRLELENIDAYYTDRAQREVE